MLAVLSGSPDKELDPDLWLSWQAVLTTFEASVYFALREAVLSGGNCVNIRDVAKSAGISLSRLVNEVLPGLEKQNLINVERE